MSGKIGTSKHKSVEWYTPKWVFDELGLEFDLDPASPYDHETFVLARVKYTVFDNGLIKPWFGCVFLNPPYSRDTDIWMRRMADHGNGIALVFSRTDSSWFQESMRKADAMLFIAGRIEFVPGNENKHKKARTGAGTAFFAFGDVCAAALKRMSDRGVLISSKAIAA